MQEEKKEQKDRETKAQRKRKCISFAHSMKANKQNANMNETESNNCTEVEMYGTNDGNEKMITFHTFPFYATFDYFKKSFRE